MRFRPHPFTVVVVVGALVGLLFSSVSTFDFSMHLDREVHDVHCSFAPGLSGVERGESGCQVALVSSYSSIFRSRVWGGVPISLPAMGVFAFLLFLAVELVITQRQSDTRATALLALATGVPGLTSIVMAYIAVAKLNAVCKLCIGIYTASALAVIGAVGLWLRARKLAASGGEAPVLLEKRVASSDSRASNSDDDRDGAEGEDPPWASGKSEESDRQEESAGDDTARSPKGGAESASTGDGDSKIAAAIDAALQTPASGTHHVAPASPGSSPRYLAAAIGAGLLFVATPVAAYLVAAPDHSHFIGTCGYLSQPTAEKDVLVPLDSKPGAPPAIIVLDPLCPACRAFEHRLEEGGFADQMDRRALLFPLDNSCNWMIDSALHPGACAISEAVICADARASEVLSWAFANQERIHDAAAVDKEAPARMVREAFPDLASCVGSPKARSRLNRSLRWAVSNQLPIMAPQLFIGGVKLCSEDVDLGLDFTLDRMLSAYRSGRLRAEAEGGDAPLPAQEPAGTARSPRRAAPSNTTTDTTPQQPSNARPAAGGTPANASDSTAAPETGADETAPETGADETAPETGADETAPETGADEASPETGAGETAPETGADETAPETGADETAPETGSEEPPPASPPKVESPPSPAPKEGSPPPASSEGKEATP